MINSTFLFSDETLDVSARVISLPSTIFYISDAFVLDCNSFVTPVVFSPIASSVN